MTPRLPAPKVCVIEDDAALRTMLETTLTRGGYEVSLATHGLDALIQIDKAEPKPHLLIVDIMLPEIDGLTLVRALKKQATTKNIPVIFLTAKTDAKTIAEGISVGAKFYLTKPFAMDDLLSKVRRAIGS
jgi:DNA-binding response OmpR family regulator